MRILSQNTMKSEKLTLIILGCMSAVLMSIPFLVPHCGFFALFGLVPLLCAERIATQCGTRRFWWYHYGTFVLWNAITTFWVCNATVGGGIFAVLANALQMSVVFALFRLSRRKFKGVLPYIFLICTWIAWEKWYFDSADISWPWLSLGNAFAGSIKSVQWYEYTGELGGSLWIWICNASVFGMMVCLSDGSWSGRFNIKAKAASVIGLIAVLTLPFVVSAFIWNRYEEKSDPVEVLIIQPNIDPYQKFQALSQEQQDAIALQQIRESLKDGSPKLVLAPETFTSNVITDHYESNGTWQRFTSLLSEYPGVNMLFGASTYDYFQQEEAPSKTARKIRDGLWMESHNSAFNIDGSGHTEMFHKNKLVVAVEKTPYPAFFVPIDNMLGGVMGRCVGQGEISLMHLCDGSAYGSAICYESVYGDYYADYVRKGAEFMTIITNDAWWGDTPGYRQHLSYASLRAIETRRSIARCANTGLSAIINQKGEIESRTSWWEPAVLSGEVNKNSSLTFFVRYGDIAGRICTFVFVLLAAALLFRKR